MICQKKYNNWKENRKEGINSGLNDTEEQISELDDRVVEITDAEQKNKEKNEMK